VVAEARGSELPAPSSRAPLQEARTVTLKIENIRTTKLADVTSAASLAEKLNQDGAVKATVAGAATDLPDIAEANRFYLANGRDRGPVRAYRGQTNATTDILELLPKEGEGTDARFRVAAGSKPGTVRIIAGTDAGDGFVEKETLDNLSLDPDSERYLIAVLDRDSSLLRAVSRHTRAHASHFPKESSTPVAFKDGAAPTEAAYEAAIEALAQEEAVDMLLAGLQDWADPNLDGVRIQRAMLGHARTQADNARPRIVLGSIKPNADVPAILDHASQVGDRRFVLVAPSGADAAMAGLLGHLDFFQSPTFKTVAAPGVPLVAYSDGELNKLIENNICVIRERRGRGTICLKGIATDGFQISVLRVADRCVRDVKRIADRFIGELNNGDSRNSLKQMIVANFKQMERDGALVPSVDGSSPAFHVEVYASDTDTAAGIARVDIAVRPVRAIDYVYATLRIKN
jgi:hypothetical protein